MALVMTELVNNALEHALHRRRRDAARHRWRSSRRLSRCRCGTTDADCPSGFDVETNSKLGLQIVRTLVTKDLNGTSGYCIPTVEQPRL